MRYLACMLVIIVFQLVSPFVAADRDEKPEDVCASYFAAWKAKNWKKMAALTTKTWRSSEKDPVGFFKDVYGFRSLSSAKITHVNRRGQITVDVTVKVIYKGFRCVEEHVVTARMIRESAPFKPSPKGKWG